MYGQELNPESYAICKADMLIKGQDINNIKPATPSRTTGCRGRVRLHALQPAVRRGVEEDREARSAEHEQQGFNGRFGPGLPRVSDGSLLFLMHLISKMRPARGRRQPLRHRAQRLAALSPAEPARARARSAATCWRTTWWRRSSAADRHVLQHRHQHLRLDREQPQAGRTARARCSSSTPAASGRRCGRASAASGRS
jgi:hypothetical protein